MAEKNPFEIFFKQFINSLPPGLTEFKQDLENHAKATLTDTARKLDLVTREEFETQKRVLQKTRLLMEEINTKLDKLSANTKNQD